MIPRFLEKSLKRYATLFPVVSVLGPRQSGKTTLCKYCFAEKKYETLENIETREYALQDPKGFLAQFPDGAILDEIQNAPELFSYIQGIVDEKKINGMFILTGSQNFRLADKISQSLAGRTALLSLLPLSNQELLSDNILPENIWERVWKGGYPRLYEQNISPQDWLPFYIQTYLERDVRNIINVGDLGVFSRFIQLLAAHTAQEVNYSALGNDLGLSHNTIKKWIGILEQSYIISLLPPWFPSTKKRIIKTPKLHFIDTGVICSLLKIHSSEELRLHSLRGYIFESWVFSEMLKNKFSSSSSDEFFHYREKNGIEFDIIREENQNIIPYEVKSSETVNGNFFKNFTRVQERDDSSFDLKNAALIYAGEKSQKRSFVSVKGWKEL